MSQVLPDAPTRDNPSVFGINLEDALFTAGGLALTGAVNDEFVYPVAKTFVPMVASSSDTMGQLVDAGTTMLTAGGLHYVLAMVNRRLAHDVLFGGVTYGAAKALAAFFPSISLSSKFPSLRKAFGGVVAMPAGPQAAGAQAALPAAGGAAPAVNLATRYPQNDPASALSPVLSVGI